MRKTGRACAALLFEYWKSRVFPEEIDVMRRNMLLAASLGLLLPNVAWAQSDDPDIKVGDYAPDFEAKEWIIREGDEGEIPSLAELRGLVVVVFFWVSWHEGGEAVLKHVNLLENHSQIGKTGGVFVVGLTDANRRVTEPLLRENMVFFPVGVKSKMAEEFDVEGGFGWIVIDAEGKLAARGTGNDVQGLSNNVTETLQKTPPSKTHPTEARRVRKLLAEAREYLKNEEYRRVFKLTRDALGRAVIGDVLMTEVFDMMDLLEAIGFDRLDRVAPLVEATEFKHAAEVLRDVKKNFAVLDAGKDAEKLYEKYEKDLDGFRDAVQAYEAEDEATSLFYAARDDLRARRFSDSYDRLDTILTDYAETEAAPYAKGMIERMKADQNFWGRILDHKAEAQCEIWLTQVRTFIRQRRYDKARELLRRIRNEYPNTKFDQQAKELLIDLP